MAIKMELERKWNDEDSSMEYLLLTEQGKEIFRGRQRQDTAAIIWQVNPRMRLEKEEEKLVTEARTQDYFTRLVNFYEEVKAGEAIPLADENFMHVQLINEKKENDITLPLEHLAQEGKKVQEHYLFKEFQGLCIRSGYGLFAMTTNKHVWRPKHGLLRVETSSNIAEEVARLIQDTSTEDAPKEMLRGVLQEMYTTQPDPARVDYDGLVVEE